MYSNWSSIIGAIIIIIIIIIIIQSFVKFQKGIFLYAFFLVIPRRMNFKCRRFGTLCSIFIGSIVET